MLSYQILNYYEFINHELNEFKEVLNPIFDWSQTYFDYSTDALVKLLKSTATSGSDGTHYIIREGKIQTGYDENVRSMKSVFSSYVIFKAFGEFKQRIIFYRSKNNIVMDDYIKNFIDETDYLFKAYDEFQKDDTNQTKMINFANELMKYKLLFNNTLKMYSDYYLLSTNEYEYKVENKNVLNIQLLDIEYTMEEFATILKDIDSSYYEIGNLIFQCSEKKEYEKLRILKIESGSLFSKIFGEEVIIDFLKKILKKAIVWVQENFKKGDVILSHKKFAAVLKEDTELMKLLEDSGCDVSNSRENIEKAFNLLSKHTLYLAKSSGSIKIDSEEFNVDSNLREKFFREIRVDLLNSALDNGKGDKDD